MVMPELARKPLRLNRLGVAQFLTEDRSERDSVSRKRSSMVVTAETFQSLRPVRVESFLSPEKRPLRLWMAVVTSMPVPSKSAMFW